MRNHQFGMLLSEGLLSVAHRRQKTKAGVEWELHEQLNQAGFTLKASTVSGWCRGFVPQDSRLVAWLVGYCVRHGRVDLPWAESVLTQARYHDSKSLLNELFSSTASLAVHSPQPEMLEHTLSRAVAIEDPLLPARSRWLVGRDALLHAVRAQVCAGESPLALHGLPGVGKTSLVLALAHEQQVRSRFPDGVLWAGLGRKPNLLELLSRWGRLLGLDQHALSKLTTLESAAETIRTAIGRRRMLLIIDDAWALEDALACLVGSPSCAHLVTTRFPELAFQIADPAVMRVPELDEEEGTRLLERVAPSLIDTVPEEARDLVQRVGGLPLALTLVGKYLQLECQSGQPRRLSAALARLNQGAGRLHVSQLQAPLLRQRHLPPGAPLSLDASIGVSYQSLHRRARAVLLALSIFPPKPNTFSEEAALQVAGATPGLLDALLAAGLLESSGPGRFTIHQTITDFARLRRRQSVDERFIAFFVRFLETHSSDYATLDQDARNCLKALDMACKGEHQAEVVRGATAIAPFLLVRGLYQLAEHSLLQAQIAARALSLSEQEIVVLRYLAESAEARGDYPRSLTLAQEGAILASQSGNRVQLGILLYVQGKVFSNLGDYIQAEAVYQKGLALARSWDDAELTGMHLRGLGVAAVRRGEFGRASLYLQDALSLARRNEQHELLCILLMNMGSLSSELGDFIQAEIYLVESLVLARAIGMHKRICLILGNLGAVMLRQERLLDAGAYLQEGLALARPSGNQEALVLLLQNLGEWARQCGDDAQATVYLEEGLALARAINHRHLLSTTLKQWGHLQLKVKHLEAARAAFSECLDLARAVDDQLRVGEAWFGLAQLAASEGDSRQALDAAQRSLDILRALGHAAQEQVAAWLATLLSGHRENIC